MHPPELAIIGRLQGWLAYEASWLGVLRIACWTAVFSVLLASMFPQVPYLKTYGGQFDDTGLTPMMTHQDEAHWVNNRPAEFPDNDTLQVAWVAGSGARLPLGPGNSTYLPIEVFSEISARSGIESRGWFYYIQAGRNLDMYTAELDAVSRKPDAVFLEINPVWVFADLHLYGFENLLNAGARLWTAPADLPLATQFAAPGNHLWSVAGRRLPRLPVTTSQGLSQWFAGRLSREPAQSLKAAKADSDKIAGAPLKQGNLFWLDELSHLKHLIPEELEGENRAARMQASILINGDSTKGTWPEWVLRRQLEVLAAADIPAVVYLSPIVPARLEIPMIRSAYEDLVAVLRDYKRDFDSANRVLLVDYPPELLAEIEQRDFVHMTEPAGFAAHLAQQYLELEQK